MKKRIFSLTALLLIAPTLLMAQPPSHLIQLNKIKLENVKHQILTLKTSISTKQKQKEHINQELKQIELIIGGSEKQFKKTTSALGKQFHSLQKTQTKQQALRNKLQKQQATLSEYIRAAYMLGRQQYVKMLLNQENPEEVNRFIQYYHYLTSARLETVNAMQKTLAQIEKTASQLKQQTQKLESIKAVEEAQQQKLKHQKAYRRRILKRVNKTLSNSQSQLQQLAANKSNLEHVLKNIAKRSYYYMPNQQFSSAKGKLPWPLRRGKIIQAFNAPIADGRLHATGMLIKAPAGTPIHAVYGGKVVFANWLRGFGSLIILQHGKNFMTLYAHVQSLYAKVGNMVKPGEVIATVGNSGGYQQNALYFEIRHRGVALDPLIWLRKRT